MASLYELTAEYTAWQEALLSDDPEEVKAAQAQLPELEADIAAKADSYAKLIKNLQGQADMYDKEAERLDKLKKSCENAVERLKAAMLQGMTTANIDKLPTTIGKWSVKTNPASCEVVDLKLIPEQYLEQQEPKPKKSEIVKWFKATGEQIPGVNIITDKKSVSFR